MTNSAPAVEVGDWVRVRTEVGQVERLAEFHGEPCALVSGLTAVARWVPLRRIVEIIR